MTRSLTKFAASTIIAVASLTAVSAQANALSLGVKLACAADYYSYCSQHAPGSAGVRTCMKSNGAKLSNRCVNALIGAGMVSKSYVDARRAAKKTAAR